MSKQKGKQPNPGSSRVSATTKVNEVVDKVKMEETKERFSFWKKNMIPALILAVSVIALYVSTLSFTHVLDDTIVITDNKFVKKGFSGIGEILSKESFEGYFGEQRNLVAGARYRPLSLVTFAIETSLFGEPSDDPKLAKYASANISHAINIIFYLCSALLLFRVLSLLFAGRASNNEEKKWWFQVPFWAALLFVLHPLHTEVVANIKGRDEIMTMLGALAALYFALRYVDTNKTSRLLASCVAFFLALLSKENALTFAAVIPLSIYFFRNNAPKKYVWQLLGALAAVSFFYLIIRVNVIGYLLSPDDSTEIKDIMNNPFYGLSAVERLATVFYTLLLYLKLQIFPHPLTHDYYPYHIPIIKSFGDWRALLSILLHIGLLIIAAMQWKKRSIVSYCILFYVLTLSIVSNLPFSVGTFMNERFVYVSSLGFCLAFASLMLDDLGRNKTTQMLGIGALGLLSFGFFAKSYERIPAWKDALSLNKAAISISKNSARANLFMGTALFQEYIKLTDENEKKKMVPEMAAYVRKSIEINPNYTSGYQMYTGILAEEYKYDKNLDKLLDGFYQSLSKTNKVPFVQQYLEYLNGTSADRSKLGAFYFKTGYELFYKTQNNIELAKKYLSYGHTVDPNSPSINLALGEVYQKIGDLDNAAIFTNRAYILDPSLKK